MSTIADHQLYKNLLAAKEAVQSHAAGEGAPTELARLLGQIDYLLWVLDNSDPDLVSSQEMDQANGLSQNLQSQIAQLPNSLRNHSRQALSEIVGLMQRFPVPRRKVLSKAESHRIIKELGLDAEVTRQTIREAFAEFDEHKRELSQRLSEIRGGQEKVSSDLEGVIRRTTETADGVTRDLETRIANTLQADKDRLTAAIDEFQRESSAAREELTTLVERQRSAFDQQQKDLSNEARSQMNRSNNEADEYVQKIKELYGIAGGDANSGQLIKSADQERAGYITFAVISGIIFLGGAYFASSIVAPILSNDIDIQIALSRIALSFAIFLPAVYTASLAGRHRKAETAYRSLGLRMAAFDPYLLSLNEAERSEMKKQLAEVFFSSQLHDELRSSRAKSEFDTFGRMADQMTNLLAKMRDLK